MLEWFFGCWHDWEVLVFMDREKIRRAIDCEISGRDDLPRLSSGDYAQKKVCLKCGKVIDQIAEEQAAYRNRIAAKAIRQARAEALLAK